MLMHEKPCLIPILTCAPGLDSDLLFSERTGKTLTSHPLFTGPICPGAAYDCFNQDYMYMLLWYKIHALFGI